MALLGLLAVRIDGQPGRASCVLPAVVWRVECRERSVRLGRDANSCRDADAKGEGNNSQCQLHGGLLLEETVRRNLVQLSANRQIRGETGA